MNAFLYKFQVKAWYFITLLLFIWLTGVTFVNAATLSLTPGTGVYSAGQTFTARVVVNTAGEKINAAEGSLSFKPTELSVVSVAKGSVFNLWTSEPSFSNSAGTISFSGGNPTGYSGSAGTVLSITFRVKGAGNPKVSFSNGAVLAADGRGTNVLTNMNGASYTIAAQDNTPEPEVIEYVAPANTPSTPNISARTHPDQDAWYTHTTAELSWILPNDVTAVRTLLDTSATTIPTKVYDTPITSITLEDLAEGKNYFHLQFKNEDGWGSVAHYRLAIDTSDPDLLSVELPVDVDPSDPSQRLIIEANDSVSSIERFEVQLNGGEVLHYSSLDIASSTLTLPAQEPGKYTVTVEAFDAAGNSIVETTTFTITAFDRPEFIDPPSVVNAGVIPVFIGQTRPRSEVTISLTEGSAEPRSYIVSSDESGGFTFIPDAPLNAGVYTISASAVDQFGAQSDPSAPIRFVVQTPGYITIGSLAVSVLSVVVPLAALIVLLGVVVVFGARRWRSLLTGVQKESSEAIAVLESEFAAIESALVEEIRNLEKSRKTKKLTKAETALVEHLRTQLDTSRLRVRGEIDDVSELVE